MLAKGQMWRTHSRSTVFQCFLCIFLSTQLKFWTPGKRVCTRRTTVFLSIIFLLYFPLVSYESLHAIYEVGRFLRISTIGLCKKKERKRKFLLWISFLPSAKLDLSRGAYIYQLLVIVLIPEIAYRMHTYNAIYIYICLLHFSLPLLLYLSIYTHIYRYINTIFFCRDSSAKTNYCMRMII